MTSNLTNPVPKGDDTGAFKRRFITIVCKNPNLYQISKLIAVTNSGCLIPNKEFTDSDNFQRERIELTVNYSSEETMKLKATNTLNLVAYDDEGLQATCPQTFVFYAKNGVLSRCPI